MNAPVNKTNQVWQHTIDALEQNLEEARDLPAWAIAAVVLGCVSILCTLLVCSCGWGMMLQQRSDSGGRAVESERGLLSPDSTAQRASVESSRPVSQAPKARRKARDGNRAKDDLATDDMEL